MAFKYPVLASIEHKLHNYYQKESEFNQTIWIAPDIIVLYVLSLIKHNIQFQFKLLINSVVWVSNLLLVNLYELIISLQFLPSFNRQYYTYYVRLCVKIFGNNRFY